MKLDSKPQKGTKLVHLLRPHRTMLVIAHRLATVRRADVLFVIDNGTIVERGSHEALLAAGGLYSHLYQIQFRHEEVFSHR